jgi:hypothetical protein
MSEITASNEMKIAIEAQASTTRADSVKDAGRVRVGAGMMRFDATKDAGRVRVGAGMMRF